MSSFIEEVPQDYDKALEWYFKAADQGDAVAQNKLGVLCEKGLGTAKNYEKTTDYIK